MAIKRIKAAINVAKTVKNIASSENPAETAGKVVAGAVQVAHPLLGRAAAPLIERGVSAAYSGVENAVKNPENQEKIKGLAAKAGRGVAHLRHGLSEGSPFGRG